MQENGIQNIQLTDEQKRKRNASTISVVTAVLLALSLIAAYVFGSIDLLSSSVIALAIIASSVSIWLSRHNKSDLGIGLIIFSLLSIMVTRVFIEKGLAIPIGITNLITVSGIAFYTLDRAWASRAIMASFFTAAATIIIDQFTVGIPQTTLPQAATIIAAIVSITYLVLIIWQIRNFPLRTKLIFGFLLLTVIPLIILGWQANSSTRSILNEQIKTKILESSQSSSKAFQEFVNSQNIKLNSNVRLPEIIDYISIPAAQRQGSQTESAAAQKLQALKDENPIRAISYSIIDKNGVDILDTDPVNIGSNFSGLQFFTHVMTNQASYASGLTLTGQPGVRIIYFAAPIISPDNEILGIMAIAYNANILQTVMNKILVERPTVAVDEYTYLVDKTNYFILAHSSSLTMNFKTYLAPSDPKLLSLESQGLITPEELQIISIPQQEIVNALAKIENTATLQIPSVEYNGELAEASVISIANSNWQLVTAQPTGTISRITVDQTRNTVLISIITTFLAALSAVIISNIFTRPLFQLTRVAENISAGDFTQKAEITTQDEIGTLASTINKMSSQIRELVVGLEQRVEQRTQELEQRTTELEKITRQSQKRADELQAIAEISGYISTEKDLEKLLTLVTQIVSERFNFYHVGIFLLSENGKFAILRAANSPGGQIMLKRQHRLEVGQVGIVGNVTYTGTPRIALDTGADTNFFNNPDLPETHSEMALPLIARGKIIGALDVQSTVSNAFTESDASILGLLADQIAIAIENARLLKDTENALAESQASFREYLAGAWQNRTASEIFGYYQTLTGGQLVAGSIPEEVEKLTSKDGDKTLSIPIQLRDQTIGTVHIRPNEESTLSKDEVNIIQAVVERLSLALDNARLFEETSSRASRERLVSDITTKIRGTNDPQEMIKTAVQELQRALGASRVEIVPRKITPPTDK